MYECNDCYERTSRLADLRDKHEVKKDEKVGGIMHIKMERSNFSEVSCETYSLDELIGKNLENYMLVVFVINDSQSIGFQGLHI